MEGIDSEVERIGAGEAWQATDEAIPVQVKRPLDKVVPVRLSAEKWEELRREAQELGVGPSTLIRMWVIERLAARRARGTA